MRPIIHEGDILVSNQIIYMAIEEFDMLAMRQEYGNLGEDKFPKFLVECGLIERMPKVWLI